MQPLASAGGEWNGEAVLAPGAIDDRTPQGFRAKDVLAAIDAGKFEIVHNVNLSPKTCISSTHHGFGGVAPPCGRSGAKNFRAILIPTRIISIWLVW